MIFKTLIQCEQIATADYGEWVVVDCRFSLADVDRGRRAYLESHIPGAFYAHLDEDLSGPIVPGETGRHPWPTVEKMTALFSSWGIEKGTQVIAYDDAGGAIAARLWWTLRWLGHDTVAVLDGGFPTWQAAKLPTESGWKVPTHLKAFVPNVKPELLADVTLVERIRSQPEYVLVDARGATRYRGDEEPIDHVAGHIPGAVNLPFADNLGSNGRFLSSDELKNRFQNVLQNRESSRFVSYCGSGVTAAHNLLGMTHAGLGDGRLYTESWSGWIANRQRPVGLGNEPFPE